MPEPESLSDQTIDILAALIGSATEREVRIITEEDLVRFACKWCSEEEEDAMIEALSTSPVDRARFVEILDQVTIVDGKVRLDVSTPNHTFRTFLTKLADASLNAFSNLRFPPPNTSNPDIRLILSHTFQEVGNRLAHAPSGFATVRGVQHSPSTAQVDDSGALVIAGAEVGQPLNLLDPVLGEIPIEVPDGRSIPGFGTELALPSGSLPASAFSLEDASQERILWARLGDREVAFAVTQGPEVVGGNIVLQLDIPAGLESYDLLLDLRAGPVVLGLGQWALAPGALSISAPLPQADGSAVPLAALALTLQAK